MVCFVGVFGVHGIVFGVHGIKLYQNWGNLSRRGEEWKTLRGLGQSFGFTLEGMKNLKRYEEFPDWKFENGKVLYNYYEFRCWLKKYEAGEVNVKSG